ncbi:hypothetical protein AVEN_205944-1 [Araneus ventricosus]|uniref:Uncharacterized protein n=1 Tax=Araneus ventricosus TaxID=182803 RepID=A0A4Y2RXR2_ARAVE|nr:hypothetical protein AVEN_205944-1 [Araneus ventricosus]
MEKRTFASQFEIMLDYFEKYPQILSGKVDRIFSKDTNTRRQRVTTEVTKTKLKIGIVVLRLLSPKMATCEIRRSDSRVVTPQHILYMIIKILRMRIVDGIISSFRCVCNMENVTRKEIEDPAFVNECVEKNFAFLK